MLAFQETYTPTRGLAIGCVRTVTVPAAIGIPVAAAMSRRPGVPVSATKVPAGYFVDPRVNPSIATLTRPPALRIRFAARKAPLSLRANTTCAPAPDTD